MPEPAPSSLPKQLLALGALACVLSFGYTAYLAHQASERNLARTAAVESYVLGLDAAARAANGLYPPSGGGYACITKNPNGKCWNQAHENAPVLEAALAPQMTGRPNPAPVNLALDGILYMQEGNGGGYTLVWLLEGAHATCEPGRVLAADYAGTGDTVCALLK